MAEKVTGGVVDFDLEGGCGDDPVFAGGKIPC
jgi:hypothetical protein